MKYNIIQQPSHEHLDYFNFIIYNLCSNRACLHKLLYTPFFIILIKQKNKSIHSHFSFCFQFQWIIQRFILFFQRNTSWVFFMNLPISRQASVGVKLSELKLYVKDIVKFKGLMRVLQIAFFFKNETNDLFFWPHQTFCHCKLTLQEGHLHGHVTHPPWNAKFNTWPVNPYCQLYYLEPHL